MVAVTQIRYRHSQGRAYYEKKLAEGKTGKEALRALKRQIRDAIFACLQADARRAAAAAAKNPGGQPGERLCLQRGRLTPRTPALRTSHSRACHPPYDSTGRRHSCSPSRAAAIPRERAAGSRTGRSPAAQRRPQGVLDAAAREPIMPRGGKAGTSRARTLHPAERQAPDLHHISTVRLTLKQRGVRYERRRTPRPRQ
jgi:hypothetical protein